jgi:hypothetical protein
MNIWMIDWSEAGPLARLSAASGVVAVLAFFVFGFLIGGWWFLFALVAATAAFVFGHVASGRQSRRSDKRMAFAGMSLGGMVVVWFAAYLVIAA